MARCAARFLTLSPVVWTRAGITVHADCALLQVAPAGGPPGGAAPSPPTAPPPLRAQLVLDCLGHASPIVKQIRSAAHLKLPLLGLTMMECVSREQRPKKPAARRCAGCTRRWGQRPDGICAVVGSMGSGFKHNTTGDVIYTFDDLTPETSRVGRSVVLAGTSLGSASLFRRARMTRVLLPCVQAAALLGGLPQRHGPHRPHHLHVCVPGVRAVGAQPARHV